MRVQPASRIVLDSEIAFGKPTIEGTRVPVAVVVGKLAGGMSFEEVAAEYDLADADVRAALGYAAQLVSRKRRRGAGPWQLHIR